MSEQNKHKRYLHSQKILCVDFYYAGTWLQNLSPNGASPYQCQNIS